MKKLVLIFLCAVLVQINARWSIHYGAKQNNHDHDHDDLDWWEHGVFYQVRVNYFLSVHQIKVWP